MCLANFAKECFPNEGCELQTKPRILKTVTVYSTKYTIVSLKPQYKSR